MFSGSSDEFLIDFLLESHIRYALETRYGSESLFTKNVLSKIPMDVFLDYVLPYSFLNEKRDMSNFRWRPVFMEVLWGAIETENPQNITAAMRIVARVIPQLALQGVYLNIMQMNSDSRVNNINIMQNAAASSNTDTKDTNSNANNNNYKEVATTNKLIGGFPISWKSNTSPMNLSPEQGKL